MLNTWRVAVWWLAYLGWIHPIKTKIINTDSSDLLAHLIHMKLALINVVLKSIKNKMAYTAKDPHPPTAFSVPNRNKKFEVGRRRREEEEGEGEKFSLKTHATTRGVGKNNIFHGRVLRQFFFFLILDPVLHQG